MSRSYDPHRHAMSPRAWPVIAPCSLFAFGLSWWLGGEWGIWGTVISIVCGCALGVVAVSVRWAIWQRRHPMTPCGPNCLLWMTYNFDKRVRAQREVAKWQ